MFPNSAYSLINIKNSEDYSSLDNPIFYLHCTKTNTEEVEIIPMDSNGSIKFPAGSFVQGAIYPIFIRKITSLGNGEFIGYIYNKKPFTI